MATAAAPASPTPAARWVQWAAGAAVAAAFVWLFRDAAFAGRLPADTVATDDIPFVGAVFEQAAAHLRDGHAPLWFPEFDCGTPLAATWMYGLLYPGLLLFAWLSFPVAWVLTAALHAGLGAAGMGSFLRHRGHGAAAVAAGAVLFAVSEHFVGRTACGHMNLVLPLAWLPWVLRFAHGAAQGERRAVALGALALGAGLLSGHGQLWMYLAPLVVVAALADSLGRRDRAAALRRVAALGLLGAGVAAAQLAITFELLGVTETVVGDEWLIRAVSAPPATVLAKLVASFPGAAPGPGELDFRHEHRGIAGMWAFGLAAWGVLRGARGRWVWAGFAVLGLFASLGTHARLSTWIQDLPPFSLARSPGRFLVLPLVCVPVLAAHGIDALPLPQWGRRAAAAAACALALLAGIPGVASRGTGFWDSHWKTFYPEDAPQHRVESRWLNQLACVERTGLRTLRAPAPVRTEGWAMVFRRLSDPVAWWLDLGYRGEPEFPEGFPPGIPELRDMRGMDLRRIDAMGPARFFGAVQFGVSDAEVFRRMESGDRTLHLDGPRIDGADAEGVVRGALQSPDRIEVEVETTGPGWLLVSMRHYPGWFARVNGQRAEIRRGNLGFPAVRIDGAGRHLVALRYDPASFTLGAAVSALAVVAAVWMVLRSRKVESPR